MTSHPLTRSITDLFCRDGFHYAGQHEFYAPMIDFILRHNLWVAELGDRVDGFMGWFRLDDASFAVVKANTLMEAISDKIKLNLLNGKYCYIAIATVAPWASRGTYRRLKKAVFSLNSDAVLVCGHTYQSGVERFWHRRIRQ